MSEKSCRSSQPNGRMRRSLSICFCAMHGFTDVLPWRKWLAGKQAERKRKTLVWHWGLIEKRNKALRSPQESARVGERMKENKPESI